MKNERDMGTKNYGVSNKAKLLNITRQTEGQTYMQVLLRFIQERFLYRLSVSEYRENFFLKGGALLYAHERFNARPTLDMDFMGDRIDRDKENIKQAFRTICAIECEEDGVMFDCGEEDVTVEDIALDREYNGVCTPDSASGHDSSAYIDGCGFRGCDNSGACGLGLSAAAGGFARGECGGVLAGDGGGREVPDDDRPFGGQQQDEGFL